MFSPESLSNYWTAALKSIVKFIILPLRWFAKAVVIASKPIGVIMSSIAALLDSPKAVRSPVLHDKAVKLLLAMLGPQLDVARRTVGSGLGRTVMRPGAPGECNARGPQGPLSFYVNLVAFLLPNLLP